MKSHYYSILFCLLSLLVLAWAGFTSASNLPSIQQPLQDKVSERYEQGDALASDFSYNLRNISNSGFFKITKKPKPQKVVAKKTSLKLKLEGIISADKNYMSRAVIRSNQKKAISYKIGDNIKGTNAELNAIEASRVIIERSGVLESLELERKKIEQSSLAVDQG